MTSGSARKLTKMRRSMHLTMNYPALISRLVILVFLFSFPTFGPTAESWAALYAGPVGRVLIVNADKEAGAPSLSLVALRPGQRPKREAALIDSEFDRVANYKIMGTFVNAARLIRSDVDMPLVARWECQSRNDGFESWFSSVPIPVDQKHPLYDRLRALQNQHMPIPEASTDDPRDLPIDAALPTLRQWPTQSG